MHPVLALGRIAIGIETCLLDQVVGAAELPSDLMAVFDSLHRVAALVEGRLPDGIAPRIMHSLDAAEPRRRGGGCAAFVEVLLAYRLADGVVGDLLARPAFRVRRGIAILVDTERRGFASEDVVGALERAIVLRPDRPAGRVEVSDLDRAALAVVLAANPRVAVADVGGRAIGPEKDLLVVIAELVELTLDLRIARGVERRAVLLVQIGHLDGVAPFVVLRPLLGVFLRGPDGPAGRVQKHPFGLQPVAIGHADPAVSVALQFRTTG